MISDFCREMLVDKARPSVKAVGQAQNALFAIAVPCFVTNFDTCLCGADAGLYYWNHQRRHARVVCVHPVVVPGKTAQTAQRPDIETDASKS